MSKTLSLRKVIQAQLNTISGGTYYRQAVTNTAFPYKTFTLSRVNLGDSARDDYDLSVDIWDRSTDTKTVDEIADQIEDLFNVANLPQTDILPTFFRESRYPVDDPDKNIQHIQLNFTVQLYTLPVVTTGNNSNNGGNSNVSN